jgi:hypothetical protein
MAMAIATPKRFQTPQSGQRAKGAVVLFGGGGEINDIAVPAVAFFSLSTSGGRVVQPELSTGACSSERECH